MSEAPASTARDIKALTKRMTGASLALSRNRAREALGLAPHDRVILALGSGALDLQARQQSMLKKVARCLDAKLRFLSDELDGATKAFPASPLFPAADAIVSAGGYHAFHEISASGLPAVFIPQERLYDDQAGRVLQDEIDRSLHAIREIEFDHRAGNLSDQDFAELDSAERAQLATLLRRRDESSG